MQGRDFVLPDDIKALVKPALSHRVILGPAARLRDLSSDQVLDEILSKVPVPGGDLKAITVRMTTGQKVVLALLAFSLISRTGDWGQACIIGCPFFGHCYSLAPGFGPFFHCEV